MILRKRRTGGVCKPLSGAIDKSYGIERTEKRHTLMCQVWITETNASEPLKKCRDCKTCCQNCNILARIQDKHRSNLFTGYVATDIKVA